MVEFIIVGLGLAGWSFVRLLQQEGRTFKVWERGGTSATHVSAGIYNPVILKRLTLAWKAPEWLPYALEVYRAFEKIHKGRKLIYPMAVHRRFTSIAEQNEWLAASGRPVYERFLNGIRNEDLPGIPAPFGFGIMKNTGLVDTALLVDLLKNDLQRQGMLINRPFRHDDLEIENDGIRYEGEKARYVVFAEGYGLTANPFFRYLPLRGTKGEALELSLEEPPGVPVKANIFLLPLPYRPGRYLAGSTYAWKDKTPLPTTEGRKYLEGELKKFYKAAYKVEGHRAGIRPTVADRRPLLGQHPKYRSLFVLNGMGTRGVILAPMAARLLLDFIDGKRDLPPETDIRRFEKRYRRTQ